LLLQSPALQAEDLQAIQTLLKNGNNALNWLRVLAKKPIDADDSVMVVEAAPSELRPGAESSPLGGQIQVGVFVVGGETNQVRLVLDKFPLAGLEGIPSLEWPTTEAAYLHFFSDYGLYRGSIKYVYDLSSGKPPVKIRYGMLALTSSTSEAGKLRYAASFRQGGQPMPGWKERDAIITITPRGEASLPEFSLREMPPVENLLEAPAPFKISTGETVLVANTTPPGEPHQPSGIYVAGQSGVKQYFPAPIPTLAFYRSVLPAKQRPGESEPGEIENDIGPFIVDGRRIWFVDSFYDGEGVSGIGAIGTFDVRTRQYEMRYLPEIAPWSGSALRLDGADLWIGLVRHPEGADIAEGLLRYNINTGAVKKYAIPDVIYTIDRLGGALYCGTSHGLYMLRGESITQLRFEPAADGKMVMLARRAP
jgi:hypothetical protein